jgi:UDP-glucose 4-epimerase
MRILLTGGTGYIGSHTAAVLVGLGHLIVLYDNLSTSSSTVVEKLIKISNKRIYFVEGDVCNTELLKKTLSQYKIELVIHCAGLKAVEESFEKPIDYYANNVHGTISLLQAMLARQIKNLVFSSSATVYGEPQFLPVDESHPTVAVNTYGRSKLHVENILSDLALSDSEWRIACLRYFNPVGAHESGLIGDSPKGIPNNLIPYIVQVSKGNLPYLSVFGDNYPTKDGTGLRDYIHVMDVADGHRAAIDFLAINKGWHAINLGTGRGYSVLDVIRVFEESTGVNIPYRIKARRKGDVAACFADPTKAKLMMKWCSSYSLEDMCFSAWRYAKDY